MWLLRFPGQLQWRQQRFVSWLINMWLTQKILVLRIAQCHYFSECLQKEIVFNFAVNMSACDVVGILCILKISRTYRVSWFLNSIFTTNIYECMSKTIHPLPRLFSENQTLGSNVCKCGVPCQLNQYDAVISNSLLDMYKIKQEITQSERAKRILPKHRDALEVSYQVCIVYHSA